MNILGNNFFINGRSLTDYSNDYVKEIFGFINTNEKIIDFAEFLPYLFEASPDVFLLG